MEIDRALADPKLLGAALGEPSTWSTWQTVLRAAFGLDLNPKQRRVFRELAGHRVPPRDRVQELWCLAGRRSGKSRMAAAIATYIATFVDHRKYLAAGEPGFVLSLSPTQNQARLVLGYCLAFLRASPILRQKIVSTTTHEIRLAGGIVIAAHPNSYRSVRGRTLLACILDEVAFFRDESSANPDLETYRAVLPALATTAGMLVGISSPYRRTGLLHAKYRDHFGKRDDRVLVIKGSTETFNPTISKSIIAAARQADPQAALAEWDAEFRSDLAQFLDDATIDRAIDHSRPLELSPQRGIRYYAFADASAGRHDHFTLSIGHKEGDRFVADVIRGMRPPFDPNGVAHEYAALVKQYGCTSITGDAYAGEWVAGAFRKVGITYKRAQLVKSALYLEALPHFMRGAVSLPAHERLIRELRLLERRTHRSGKDSVDHGQGGSDDYANAVCGCVQLAIAEHRTPVAALSAPRMITGHSEPYWIGGDS
jgi:hypothetical protein